MTRSMVVPLTFPILVEIEGLRKEIKSYILNEHLEMGTKN